MSDDLVNRFKRYRGDLEVFCSECLKVRTKDGRLVPFTFNRAQREVHRRLEEQRASKGWVRAIILKGRQQGMSTYIAARDYHRSSLWQHVNVYILAHEQQASDQLFSIVERYHKYNPFAPATGKSNIKELEFERLESSYAVATAGAKATGRSRTLSLLHASEVAFWPNASEHFASSIQGVPLAHNTEIILESTSAGASGEYYERYQMAEAGIGDYIAIFVPWFWSDEYRRTVEPGFELSTDSEDGEMSELEYAETYGLDHEQMMWRRAKISELRNPVLFRREYPACPAEAWTAPAGQEPYIDSLAVIRARRRFAENELGIGPLIIGVDPASLGGDRFSIAARRGNRCEWVRHRNKLELLEATQWIIDVIEKEKPQRVNIDAGGIGIAVVSALRSMKPDWVNLVKAINFGGTSEHKLARPKVPGPANRRAEMWARTKEWLESPEGAALPNDDALQSDLCAPRLKPKLNNDFLLESKQELKKRGVRSPDLADALALTFASKEILPFDIPGRVPNLLSPTGDSVQNRPQITQPTGRYGWMA